MKPAQIKIAVVTFSIVTVLMVVPWWYVRLPLFFVVATISVLLAAGSEYQEADEIDETM